MQDFRKLSVWQKAHRLAIDSHALFAVLSKPGHFHIRDQLVRAADSVAANIAEGCGRTGDKEFRRFVRLALGSATELEYHLILVRDLGLLPEAEYVRLSRMAAEIKRMLSGLAARLSTDIKLKADG